jgi:hypothetical protein
VRRSPSSLSHSGKSEIFEHQNSSKPAARARVFLPRFYRSVSGLSTITARVKLQADKLHDAAAERLSDAHHQAAHARCSRNRSSLIISMERTHTCVRPVPHFRRKPYGRVRAPTLWPFRNVLQRRPGKKMFLFMNQVCAPGVCTSSVSTDTCWWVEEHRVLVSCMYHVAHRTQFVHLRIAPGRPTS